MTRVRRTMVRLTMVMLVALLGLACSDDSDKPQDGATGDGLADGGSGDLHAKMTIKSITPETATLIVNMLQDITVELSRPPQTTTYVDVVSKDPATISVVTATLTFSTYDTEEMTTVQALKLTSGAEAKVEFTLRGTSEKKTFSAKVQKVLPDAGFTDI